MHPIKGKITLSEITGVFKYFITHHSKFRCSPCVEIAATLPCDKMTQLIIRILVSYQGHCCMFDFFHTFSRQLFPLKLSPSASETQTEDQNRSLKSPLPDLLLNIKTQTILSVQHQTALCANMIQYNSNTFIAHKVLWDILRSQNTPHYCNLFFSF